MSRAGSIVFALALLSISSSAFARPAHPRSLQTAQAKKTLAVLDEAERDEARRREEIARRQAEQEHRESMDRVTMLVLLGAAAAIVVVWEINRTKRSSGARAPRPTTPGSDRARDRPDA